MCYNHAKTPIPIVLTKMWHITLILKKNKIRNKAPAGQFRHSIFKRPSSNVLPSWPSVLPGIQRWEQYAVLFM
ncbi:hypothetical protein DSUL_100143 [Desulfovibrionales bacterium]